jgi:hypothetical protein
LKLFEASIHAQTFSAAVTRERKDIAKDIRPEQASPTSSVIAPTGKPPWSSSSKRAIPVCMTGRIIRAGGVSADGILCASADSTWIRIVEAEGMAKLLRFIFAYLPAGVSTGGRTSFCADTTYLLQK